MKKRAIPVLSFLLLFAGSKGVHAHCPLCVGAVGAAATVAELYGVDASIVGLFVGALGISMGLFTARKLKRQYIPFQAPIVVIISFILTILPVMYVSSGTVYMPVFLAGDAGSLLNKVYWVSKLVVGGMIGGVAGAAAFGMHHYTKKLNGKVLFPYQGVVFTIGLLTVAGLIMTAMLGIYG